MHDAVAVGPGLTVELHWVDVEERGLPVLTIRSGPAVGQVGVVVAEAAAELDDVEPAVGPLVVGQPKRRGGRRAATPINFDGRTS